jgi:hypothetical protein
MYEKKREGEIQKDSRSCTTVKKIRSLAIICTIVIFATQTSFDRSTFVATDHYNKMTWILINRRAISLTRSNNTAFATIALRNRCSRLRESDSNPIHGDYLRKTDGIRVRAAQHRIAC